MNDLLRHGRAWIRVLKTAALFMLPLPLWSAFLLALITGEFARFAGISGALAAFLTAGVLTWKALVAEARFFLGERLDPPAVPLKLVSAVLTAAGAGLSAAAGNNGLVGIGIFAALAGAGYLCFYGRDPRRQRIELPEVAGVDRSAVTAQLKQAHGRLQGIENAARAIAVREFRDRLTRIIEIGRRILDEIARDPRYAARARRFLNIYLDSAEKVTAEYARTHKQIRNRPLEENFRQLLVDMEHHFEAQYQKLLDNDLLSLDVEIEVLNARLKREGID